MNEIKYLEIEENLSSEELEILLVEKGIEGAVVKSIKFPDINDATEYLSELVTEDKSIVVKFEKVIDDISDNKGYQDLIVRLEEMNTSLREFPNVMLEKVRTQTSHTRGCKNPECKSSINRVLLLKKLESIEDLNLNDLYCPICEDSDFIISNTDHKRLGNIISKIEFINTKIEEKKAKLISKAKKEEVLLVGYYEVESGESETIEKSQELDTTEYTSENDENSDNSHKTVKEYTSLLDED